MIFRFSRKKLVGSYLFFRATGDRSCPIRRTDPFLPLVGKPVDVESPGKNSCKPFQERSTHPTEKPRADSSCRNALKRHYLDRAKRARPFIDYFVHDGSRYDSICNYR